MRDANQRRRLDTNNTKNRKFFFYLFFENSEFLMVLRVVVDRRNLFFIIIVISFCEKLSRKHMESDRWRPVRQFTVHNQAVEIDLVTNNNNR